MTKATLATPQAEEILEAKAQSCRIEAQELQSKATETETRAAELRAQADQHLDLAAQCDEAARDLRAHRREHPRKDDAKPAKVKA